MNTVLLLTSLYMDWSRRTSHSSIPSLCFAHQMTSRGTRSNAFFRSTKDMQSGLLAAKCFCCSCKIKIASVVPRSVMKTHCISSTSTLCLMSPSIARSNTFITCSINFRLTMKLSCQSVGNLECIPLRLCPLCVNEITHLDYASFPNGFQHLSDNT